MLCMLDVSMVKLKGAPGAAVLHPRHVLQKRIRCMLHPTNRTIWHWLIESLVKSLSRFILEVEGCAFVWGQA